MRRLLRLTALAPALLAGAAVAGPLDEPHLKVVPRTADEAARIAAATAAPTDFGAAQPFEEKSGGAATVRARQNADAFSQPSANIGFEGELEFKVGNGLFRKVWVSAPSSTLASDGLGPLFNARSCQRCHLKDGRGHPPLGPGDDQVSMILKIGIPGGDPVPDIEDYLATHPDPVYGSQLQDFSVAGVPAEGRIGVSYAEEAVVLNGGETVRLRRPVYEVADDAYGPLDPEAAISPRIAPQMIGMGLLEAIPAADILAGADPEDADGDGISGRANLVWSRDQQAVMLGRFGWKATAATVRDQSASAFSGDMGISNPLLPDHAGDCTPSQAACRAAPDGGGDDRGTEIDDAELDLVAFYSRNLGVPARRDVGDAEVLRGKALFHAAGCAACHRPAFVTHRLEDEGAQSFQLIWPYTDMLLHDMGPGLADGLPEARAEGGEWRTPPLWGIGMTKTVSGHEFYLHDGRARTLTEAILWHGGEAEAARARVVDMTKEERDALIRYLGSL